MRFIICDWQQKDGLVHDRWKPCFTAKPYQVSYSMPFSVRRRRHRGLDPVRDGQPGAAAAAPRHRHHPAGHGQRPGALAQLGRQVPRQAAAEGGMETECRMTLSHSTDYTGDYAEASLYRILHSVYISGRSSWTSPRPRSASWTGGRSKCRGCRTRGRRKQSKLNCLLFSIVVQRSSYFLVQRCAFF